MVRLETDWKRLEPTTLNWLVILLAGALTADFLALWWTVRIPVYLLLALIFVSWLSIFSTKARQPILLLTIAGITGGILFLWSYNDLWKGLFGQVGILLCSIFLLMVTYSYLFERGSASQA